MYFNFLHSGKKYKLRIFEISEELVVADFVDRTLVVLAKNQVFCPRTKHVDIRYHFVREKVAEGKIKMGWIAGELNPADGLTKPLAKTKFEKFRKQIGMRRIDID